jgi:hypothetical protein
MKTAFTMRSLVIWSASLLCILTLSSCYGLAVSDMGKHYQTEKAPELDGMSFKKIGVYAVSDGKAQSINGTNALVYGVGMYPFWVIPFPYTAALISRPNVTDIYGFSPGDFPSKITIPFKVRTDSVNTGPSFELALAVQKQLDERGFQAEAVSDMSHSGNVSSDAILSHAKNAGYDAAFVMVYTLYKRWQRMTGSQTVSTGYRSTATIVNVSYYEGYLFLPSAALVDVNTGRILWSSAYYGLVSNAHTPNVSNQAMSVAVNEAIIEQGRDTYVDAAKVTVDRLFSPKYWKGSYKPFPAPKQKKGGEKFDF